MSAPTTFSYRLTGAGWSTATLAIGQRQVELTASYLGDALGELLQALVELVDGHSETQVFWEEEPGEFRWLLTAERERLHLRLFWFEDNGPERWPLERGQCRLDTELNLRTFVGAVATGAQTCLDEWGLDGYRAQWIEADFPVDALRRLQEFLATPSSA